MDYEVEYVPDAEYAEYVRSQKAKEMIVIEGKNRWLVTKEDDTKVVVRPESSK